LTADELKALLAELTGAYRVMVFVVSTTGLRVSELLRLNRWSDCDFDASEIRLSRGIVRQHEIEMKTEASRKPVPMEKGLADVLMKLANGVWVQPAIGLHLRITGYGRLAAALAEQCNEETHSPYSGTSKDRQTHRLAHTAPHVRHFA
jgi:integrase